MKAGCLTHAKRTRMRARLTLDETGMTLLALLVTFAVTVVVEGLSTTWNFAHEATFACMRLSVTFQAKLRRKRLLTLVASELRFVLSTSLIRL